jgi:hypothetical protein
MAITQLPVVGRPTSPPARPRKICYGDAAALFGLRQ